MRIAARHSTGRAFTFVEVLCALTVAVLGFGALFETAQMVQKKAIWVLCFNQAQTVAFEDLSAALDTTYDALRTKTNPVTLYSATDGTATSLCVTGNLYRWVSYPEGTNLYKVVRCQVEWSFGPYGHRNYTNWAVTYAVR
jgi:hypothetical protein